MNRQGNGNGSNRAQFSSAAPVDRAAPRVATSGTSGGENRASLSFVTPYIAMRFDILPKQLLEPFTVSTHVGESILAEKVYRDYANSINHKDTMVDLVELDMVDFDVLIGMDWLNACYTSIDCRTRVVKLHFPNEPITEWRSSSTMPKGHFVSYLKARKLVSKRDLEFEVDDWVYLKVSPMKDVMRFVKKGKLSPQYIGPYRILKRTYNVAYELKLSSELAAVQLVFHISMLKKCMGNPSLIIPTENIGIKNNLSYEDIPIQILDCEVCKFRPRRLHQSRSYRGISLLRKLLGRLRRI
ncbi:hypothetical protein MTR67_002624 [Solanum verrucosum]|uniref:Tf2-1-like SH3-like domain-containing protein n=1 Tax=Solanum verrucosum TaxID=315347 RepID=A0AAF0PQH7_SOLVR|nr:hypothetical protein MTR67_002624 [Solanum verrucosum]